MAKILLLKKGKQPQQQNKTTKLQIAYGIRQTKIE